MLVGQSMGGHTALPTAAWHPGLVAKLVLVVIPGAGHDVHLDRPEAFAEALLDFV